jgi:cellulose synthase (UDP-forming)
VTPVADSKCESADRRRGGSACRPYLVLVLAQLVLGCSAPRPPAADASRVARLDALSALWSFYKFHYVDAGRVVSLDEDHVTTSEGQGYAMLRAVWSGDAQAFESAWSWTRQHLQVRDDRLFAWKWKGRVLDVHSATDADTDIALALLLAASRFSEPRHRQAALEILADLWDAEILQVGDAFYPVAGDWARKARFPVIHVAYLAPYAYEEFARADPSRPWGRVRDTSYAILHWLYFERGVRLPPEIVHLDRHTGALRLQDPRSGKVAPFSYDSFPIFWRVALDARWNWRGEERLRERMLAPLREAWQAAGGRIYDRYGIDGRALSKLEALPLYATAHSLALVEDPDFAAQIRTGKLDGLWLNALQGLDTPYYLHNWLWFDAALELRLVRRFDELLGFLWEFDLDAFARTFPRVPFAACVVLFPLALLARRTRLRRWLVPAFLVAAFAVCLHYLVWRALFSLNFAEPLGPFISLSLWLAELYCFASVVLLVVQAGIGRPARRTRPAAPGFRPSVDVLIPIYKEPLEILEQTLVAAGALRYPRMRIHVLDDGHRDEVRELALACGAEYLRGPRRHAKAGNLNQALAATSGELLVVFDTDHIPLASFLEETVPWFADPRVGFVQTPHHFRNPDIFQRAFRVVGRVPNEQDMFNHGIQAARDAWEGAFFVGSGAVFRRAALEGIGGFNLLSITEDIHTSQHLHAAGWRSVHVNRDLAVGLSAEDLSSYIVQRRRWMLGCLQIFFRDNPLRCRGLSARQRWGYFASLYYFFFPLARLVFWTTPLWYLLFHLHPILSDVSVLTALLIPYLVLLPMISAVLLPGWPRTLWGSLYESAVAAPLARSMLDLLIPSALGFKVTPKGIVTRERRFDWRSAKWTLGIAGLTAFAIAKGLWEFHHFGIERDAYFFNLAWASYNLLFLLAALLLAWERPQRRADERVQCELPARLELPGGPLPARTLDVSLGGCSLWLESPRPLPPEFECILGPEIRVRAALVYQERIARRCRAGMRFVGLTAEARRALLLGVIADPHTWERAHARELRSRLGAAATFVRAIAGFFRPLRTSRRRHPRRRRLALLRLLEGSRQRSVLLRDLSPGGIGLLCVGREAPGGDAWRISGLGGAPRWGRVIHVRRRLPAVWYVGIEWIAEPQDSRDPEVELAA